MSVKRELPAVDSFRNRTASWLANRALMLATPYYRNFVEGAIIYGMDAAARDAAEDRDLPPDWFADYPIGP